MKCLIDVRLKELRTEQKITQKKFAELCGVKQSCVSKWERGETLPDAQTIVIICEVLGVSADLLLGLKDY